MIDPIELRREFFEGLMAVDREIVARAAEEPCRDCGGPLHRGDYPRKPRGGLLAAGTAAWERRFSLCCGRDGCRHRATPPSVRFLGRRVYAGAVVILASAVALAVISAAAVVRRDRRAGADDAAMAPVVARPVRRERVIRGPVQRAWFPHQIAALSPPRCSKGSGAIRSRRREAPRLAGAPHHGELPRWIAMAEGRDVTAPTTGLAQKMALPRFFPSA